MSSRRSVPPSNQTAALPQGGCLSGFLLPPLAVVCVGALLAFLLLGSVISPSSNSPMVETSIPSQTGISLSPVFTPEVQHWGAAIQRWATAAGLDPNLVATVMQIESCGDPSARSQAGAMGLFQVMPYHFATTDNPYDPDTNALRGMDYLRRSLEAAHSDPRLALAGYNGGIGVIGRSEFTWATQTQLYAYWGSGIYADASIGLAESLRLQEWLATNGRSLCLQARNRLGINP